MVLGRCGGTGSATIVKEATTVVAGMTAKKSRERVLAKEAAVAKKASEEAMTVKAAKDVAAVKKAIEEASAVAEATMVNRW
jgi:hypothetical protein